MEFFRPLLRDLERSKDISFSHFKQVWKDRGLSLLPIAVDLMLDKTEVLRDHISEQYLQHLFTELVEFWNVCTRARDEKQVSIPTSLESIHQAERGMVWSVYALHVLYHIQRRPRTVTKGPGSHIRIPLPDVARMALTQSMEVFSQLLTPEPLHILHLLLRRHAFEVRHAFPCDDYAVKAQQSASKPPAPKLAPFANDILRQQPEGPIFNVTQFQAETRGYRHLLQAAGAGNLGGDSGDEAVMRRLHDLHRVASKRIETSLASHPLAPTNLMSTVAKYLTEVDENEIDLTNVSRKYQDVKAGKVVPAVSPVPEQGSDSIRTGPAPQPHAAEPAEDGASVDDADDAVPHPLLLQLHGHGAVCEDASQGGGSEPDEDVVSPTVAVAQSNFPSQYADTDDDVSVGSSLSRLLEQGAEVAPPDNPHYGDSASPSHAPTRALPSVPDPSSVSGVDAKAARSKRKRASEDVSSRRKSKKKKKNKRHKRSEKTSRKDKQTRSRGRKHARQEASHAPQTDHVAAAGTDDALAFLNELDSAIKDID